MASPETTRVLTPTQEDFYRYNGKLNDVKIVMMRMAGERSIPECSFECWRWDEPTITMSIGNKDGIMRKIETSVSVDEKTSYESLVVGIAAWTDDIPTATREWNSSEIRRLRMDPPEATLRRVLETAYDRVSAWTRDDLAKKASIQLLPR